MKSRAIAKGIIVGTIVQLVVGWITPITLVFTGFLAGMVARDEEAGTIAGTVIGVLAGAVSMISAYLNFQILYLFPISPVFESLGPFGIYFMALLMIGLGLIGGKMGGSMMQTSTKESYRHGRIYGEGKEHAEAYGKSAKTKASRKRR